MRARRYQICEGGMNLLERLSIFNKAQVGDRPFGVGTITGETALWLGQKTAPFVVAHSFDVDTDRIGKFADGHKCHDTPRSMVQSQVGSLTERSVRGQRNARQNLCRMSFCSCNSAKQYEGFWGENPEVPPSFVSPDQRGSV